MDEFGIAPGVIIYPRHAVGPRPDLGTIPHPLIVSSFKSQSLFEVVHEEFESFLTLPASQAEPVIGGPHVIRHRSIIAAGVKQHQQVVGKVYRIQHHRMLHWRNSVRSPSGQFQIIFVGRNSPHGPRTGPELVPGAAGFHGAVAGFRGMRPRIP